MSHTAIEFGVTGLTPDQAVNAALTAADTLPGGDATLAEGTVVSYKRQPTLDELQHVAKQLLPKPTSSEFAQSAKALIGSTLKATTKKGKKGGPSQAAVWAGNLRRLAREIAVTGKATARAAGKRSVRTAGKAVSRTGGGATNTVPGANDPVADLVGTHCNQQAPTIGIEIRPKQTTDADAYYVPANCVVFTNGKDWFANIPDGTEPKGLQIVGISTADGVESTQSKIYKELQHVSVVATGLVSLMCSPARAKMFSPGDPVYINDVAVPLRRKPEIKVATFTTETEGAKVGRFIEICGSKGGIRVQLNIENK